MVDILWLTGKYPHIIPTMLRENPLRYDGPEFESRAKEFIENDNYLKEYKERLEKN